MQQVKIPFRGWDLIAWINSHDGEQLIAVRPIAEAIGVDWKTQRIKIQRNKEFRWGLMPSTATDGKNYEMLCLPVKQLNDWLFSIGINKVKSEVRENLRLFKEECREAIYNHISGRANPELVKFLMKTIEQLEMTITELRRENSELRKDYAEMQGSVERLAKRQDYYDEVLGIEASVAGKRLNAAKQHLSLVNGGKR